MHLQNAIDPHGHSGALTSKRNDTLKLLALITMLIDHIGYLFFPDMLVLRTIGRIAFPIFAYQVAQGYYYTSDLKKYTSRLAFFAVISIPPYAFFNEGLHFDPLTFNIMFTLLMGIGAMKLWDIARSFCKKDSKNRNLVLSGLFFIVWFSYMWLPQVLMAIFHDVSLPMLEGMFDFRISYSSYGLFMIMIFYWFKDKPLFMSLGYIMISFGFPFLEGYIAYGQYYMGPNYGMTFIEAFNEIRSQFTVIGQDLAGINGGIKTLSGFFFQSRSLLGLLAILVMGKRQWAFSMPRAFAYWFYPVHITILILFKLYPQLWVWLQF